MLKTPFRALATLMIATLANGQSQTPANPAVVPVARPGLWLKQHDGFRRRGQQWGDRPSLPG